MSEISMSHPSEGEWRAWLDGEAAEDARLGEEHLKGCPACRTSVDELRAGSTEVSGLLELVAPDSAPTATERNTRYAEGLAPAAAGIRLVESTERAEESTVEEKEPVMVSNSILKRWRIAAGAVAAALALGVVLATPVGQTAFAQFLAQFRSEQFAVVAFDPSEVTDVHFDLEAIGTIEGDSGMTGGGGEVASLDEAAQLVGFTPVEPADGSLPAGVTGPPIIMATEGGEFRFTFDKARGDQHFASIGSDLTVPSNLDGVSLVVQTPAAVILTYGTGDSIPALVIGQSLEITAGVDGAASLEEVRSFMLELPGLPPSFVQQLGGIEAWATTLPIPIPLGEFDWEETAIGGGEGVILNDNTGVGSAAIWQRAGRIYFVGGQLKASEIRDIADGLR